VDRLAHLLDRRPARFLVVALCWTAAAAYIGGPVVGKLSASGRLFDDPASESVGARKQLERASGSTTETALVALVATRGGVDTAATEARVRRVVERLRSDPAVARVVSFYDTHDTAFVSRDGRLTYVSASLEPLAPTEERGVANRIESALGHEPGVDLGGWLIAGDQVNHQVESDLVRAELFVFPLLFLLSLLVFRGLVAAALPPIVGLVAISSTFVFLRVINDATPLSVYAVNTATGLGLGLAIDYSLLIVSRYREELVAVTPAREALRRTMASAGRTILFSAVTVAAALAALLAFPQPFLYSMGIGGVLAAFFAGAAALIVLPAILAALGPRVNALAPSRLRAAAARTARLEASGFWYRLAQVVMRRAGLVAVGSAALLIALGVPFLGVKFTGIDESVLPKSASAARVSQALETRFTVDRTSPVYVAVAAPPTAAASVASLAARLRRLPSVAGVAAPQSPRNGVWRIDVYPRQPALAPATKKLVRQVRAIDVPLTVRVGGETAAFLDLQSSLRSHLPIGLGILALATVVILFVMTGSVVLPVKALLMNVLTLSATFGLLVLVFQDGRLESVLRYTGQGALESTQPILLAAVAFALSTDYAVFLLARIKEARDAGASNTEAVARGLERTGRIVTSAALLLCVAVGAFSISEIVFIKELGLGIAVAVILDATIVRALLVPSLMKLLGGRNWWAPGPLRRLHERIGWSEAGPPAPRLAE
jgi:RND superfamily putative drug exporter